MDAKEYLESLGIKLEATTLVCYIDGFNRQPNLVSILEGYHEMKKITDKNINNVNKRVDKG
jgi:hypothetical protein